MSLGRKFRAFLGAMGFVRAGKKQFYLPAEQIRPLANGHGACIATDRITVNGQKVGYMYRDEPDHNNDSGWRFMAGDESQKYMDDPGNLAFYDVNTIANYDPDIIPFLEAPFGSAFARNSKTDTFDEVEFESLE